MKSVVIGIGSPFGGDTVGWQVVERLKRLLPDGVAELVQLDRPGALLLDQMAAFDQVILIDAAIAEEGGVSLLNREQLAACSAGTLSSHGVGVAEAIALGAAMNQLPKQLCCVAVGLQPEGCDQGIAVQEAAELVVEQLRRWGA